MDGNVGAVHGPQGGTPKSNGVSSSNIARALAVWLATGATAAGDLSICHGEETIQHRLAAALGNSRLGDQFNATRGEWDASGKLITQVFGNLQNATSVFHGTTETFLNGGRSYAPQHISIPVDEVMEAINAGNFVCHDLGTGYPAELGDQFVAQRGADGTVVSPANQELIEQINAYQESQEVLIQLLLLVGVGVAVLGTVGLCCILHRLAESGLSVSCRNLRDSLYGIITYCCCKGQSGTSVAPQANYVLKDMAMSDEFVGQLLTQCANNAELKAKLVEITQATPAPGVTPVEVLCQLKDKLALDNEKLLNKLREEIHAALNKEREVEPELKLEPEPEPEPEQEPELVPKETLKNQMGETLVIIAELEESKKQTNELETEQMLLVAALQKLKDKHITDLEDGFRSEEAEGGEQASLLAKSKEEAQTKQQIESIEAQLAKINTALQSRISKDDVEALIEKHKTKLTIIEKHFTDHQKVDEFIRQLDEVKQIALEAKKTAEDSIQKESERIKGLEQQIEELKIECQSQNSKHQELEAKLLQANDELDKLTDKLNEVEVGDATKTQKIEDSIADKEDKIAILEDRVGRCEQLEASLTQKSNTLTAQVDDIKQSIQQKFKEEMDSFDVAKGEFEENKQILEELTEQQSTLLKDLEAKTKEQNPQIEELLALHKTCTHLQEEINTVSQNQTQLNTNFFQVEKTVNEMQQMTKDWVTWPRLHNCREELQSQITELKRTHIQKQRSYKSISSRLNYIISQLKLKFPEIPWTDTWISQEPWSPPGTSPAPPVGKKSAHHHTRRSSTASSSGTGD